MGCGDGRGSARSATPQPLARACNHRGGAARSPARMGRGRGAPRAGPRPSPHPDRCFRSRPPRQAEELHCNDPPHDLRRPRRDARRARRQVRALDQLLRVALVAARLRRVVEQALRPEDLHRDLRQQLRQLRPVQLDDRGLRPRRPEADELVERPLAGEAEDLRPEIRLGQRLAQQGVAAGAALAGHGDQAVALLLQQHLHADDVEDAALVLQRRDGDLPSAVQLAEQVLARYPHVLEEDLVEVGVARHLPQRTHLDARAPTVHQQARHAARPPRRGIGPAQDHAPVGVVSERGPDLLTGEPEVIAVEHRLGAERRQVRARARLRESEAPEVVGRQDAWQETPLLLVGAVGDDRRPGDADPEVADHLGRACPRHLLDVGELLRDGRVTATELARPVDAHPAGLRQRPLPGAQAANALVLRHPGGVLGAKVVGNVCLQPRPQLLPEGVDALLGHGHRLAGRSAASRVAGSPDPAQVASGRPAGYLGPTVADSPPLLSTRAEVATLADRVRSAGRLALDTEFVWERTYRPTLGVVQIATDDTCAILDATVLPDLSPLFPVLRDPKIPVVLHGGGQDLEIMALLMGEPMRGVVDTQVEAAFLGYGLQVGLSVLLDRVLKVRIRKDQTYTDWTRRPLKPEQLAYARADVVHLLALHDRLCGDLERRERLAWVEEELKRLEDGARYQAMPDDERFHTVKGWQRLEGNELAVLRELAAWRERAARKANIRPNFIANDVVLVTLASRPVAHVEELRGVRGLSGGTVDRHGRTIVAAIRAGRECPKDRWPSPPDRVRRQSPPSGLVALLRAAVQAVADRDGLASEVIASARDLDVLVACATAKGGKGDAGPDSALLQGWRRTLVGETLLAIARGELAMRYDPARREVLHEEHAKTV